MNKENLFKDFTKEKKEGVIKEFEKEIFKNFCDTYNIVNFNWVEVRNMIAEIKEEVEEDPNKKCEACGINKAEPDNIFCSSCLEIIDKPDTEPDFEEDWDLGELE